MTINGETDGGDEAEESISLPVYPCPFVLSVLLDIVQEMNRVGGHSLEKVKIFFFV